MKIAVHIVYVNYKVPSKVTRCWKLLALKLGTPLIRNLRFTVSLICPSLMTFVPVTFFSLVHTICNKLSCDQNVITNTPPQFSLSSHQSPLSCLLCHSKDGPATPKEVINISLCLYVISCTQFNST